MAKLVHVMEEIEVPDNVEIVVDGSKITVKGPLGTVTRDFSHVREVKLVKNGNKLIVEAYRVNRRGKAKVFTVASHIRNMIIGVTRGYRYVMKIVSTHFPITVSVDKENGVVRIKNFLGEKADRLAKIYGNVNIKVSGDEIIITGVDIEQVGLTASSIERATRVKDKDRRIFLDGIYIVEKGVGIE
ncbi:MAG: 50S ribosomal protein L6 [Desulfurococcaceae archaeon]